MKLNEEKRHLSTETSINVGPSMIKESSEEKKTGVIIDRKLNLKQQLNMVCRKASQKLLQGPRRICPKEKLG